MVLSLWSLVFLVDDLLGLTLALVLFLVIVQGITNRLSFFLFELFVWVRLFNCIVA